MSEKIRLKDFVELDYTGKLPDGTIFDTTREDVAKKNSLLSEKVQFHPVIIVVGERQLLPGLDQALVDKELNQEYTVTLAPEQAFGKREIKRIKIVPLSTFAEHDLSPYPGLQVDMDGEVGTVTKVNGGRIMVNFNHPLAGREVVYEFKVLRKVAEPKEQITAYLHTTLGIPEKDIHLEIKEEKAEVRLPMDVPPFLTEPLTKKLLELTAIKAISFSKTEPTTKPAEKKAAEDPNHKPTRSA